MHESAPECCNPGQRPLGHKRTYATFATYSSDGRQVVASFFGDAVHVFDLAQDDTSVPCRSPFLTRPQKRAVIFKWLQQSSTTIDSDKALSTANNVLQVEPDNLLALVLRAEAFLRRRRYGDLRSSFATFSRILTLLEQDQTRISQLWGFNKPDGPPCMPPDSSHCKERADIWMQVFRYKKAYIMLRMLPGRRAAVLDRLASKSIFKTRLEQVNVLISQIEDYRKEAGLFPKLKRGVYKRALGDLYECSQLYQTRASAARGVTLQRIFDSFFEGSRTIRKDFETYVFDVLHQDDHNIHSGDTWEVIEQCSTGSNDEDEGQDQDRTEIPKFLDNPHPLQEFSEDQEMGIWGPPPAAQDKWRSFHGAISRQTEIKEARFYGAKNQVVVSGSDDGLVYMWSATTGELLTRIPGDDQIVNCVLPHPTRSMILNSGIDSTIKVISPEWELRV